MKDIDSLAKAINSYPSDIKAEVLMADLIEAGFSQSDFIVFFKSSFRRGYSHDILKAGRYRISDIHEILAVNLARDGLYDLLPEGMFHASPDSVGSSGKAMASDSKAEAKIEEETRKFFLPFENEFFYQRVQLELQERSILQRLSDNTFEDFFLNFWKIDRSLPRDLIINMSAMLPFIKDIVGDFELTANCLGAILDEKVTHKIAYSSKSFSEKAMGEAENGSTLGSAVLGVDMINGGYSLEKCKLIRFSIGPLKNTGLEPYLENGNIARFIECFCSYFLPMELDFEFEVIMPEDRQGLVLGGEKDLAVMGYTTVI